MKSILSRFSLILFSSFFLWGCKVEQDSGLWRGTVVVREANRHSYTCEVEIEIFHTEHAVTVDRLSSSCVQWGRPWKAGRFEIGGDTLWKKSRAAGFVGTDKTVRLDLSDAITDEPIPFANHGLTISWQRIGEGADEILVYSDESHYGKQKRRSSGFLKRVR